jgi:undecaprenyl-diphosphatase
MARLLDPSRTEICLEAWLQTAYTFLPEGRSYYVLLAGIALLESIAGVGLVVPGSILIVFAGFLSFHGKGDFTVLAGAVAAGACVGDLLSYLVGARFGAWVLQREILRRHHQLLDKAQVFFSGHGGKSVFFGRFLGPLRGFIPFVAGCARMHPLVYVLYTLLSCLAWGLVYPGLGYLGGASWQQVRLWTGRFSLVILFLLALFILNGLFWKAAAPRLSRCLVRVWERVTAAWGSFLQTPAMSRFIAASPRLWAFLAKRFSLHSGTGLYLTTGFLISSFFAALFVWLVIDLPAVRNFDGEVYSLFSELRHPAADVLMAAFASLADGPVLLLVAGYVLLWLVLHNRDLSAVVLVVGLAGGEMLLFLLHHFFNRPGPEPFLAHLPEVFNAFPSGHAFSTYLLYGLTVYFIVGSFSQWKSRLTVVIAGSFLALLVGFSRIYLGIQWTSSVLAGYALAALWLTFLVTAAEMRRRYGGEFPWRAGWEPLHLSRRWRGAILTLAGVLDAGALVCYLVGQLRIL